MTKSPMTPDQIARLPYRACVGMMLVNSKGRIFVGERLDSPGAWQMPQGGIDPGESPEQAVLRELQEETGIQRDLVEVRDQTPNWIPYDLPHDLVPRLWKGRYRGQEQKWFLLGFQGKDEDINIATHTPEFARWRWLERGDLVQAIVPFKRGVYQEVLQSFENKF